MTLKLSLDESPVEAHDAVMTSTTATARADQLVEGDIIYHAMIDFESLVTSVTHDGDDVYVEATGGCSAWYPNLSKVVVVR